MMFSRIVGVWPILAFAFAITISAESGDWLIIPGKRVGPITAATTRADLVRIFGAKNVQDDEIVATDGGREWGTTVFGDQPSISLSILWKDDSPDAHSRWILFCRSSEPQNTCRWHTPDGITFGTSLKTLEKINERKFKLNGFDWGYGGSITSWNGGRLEILSAGCGSVTIRLDPPPGAPSEERTRLLEQVEGDTEFWSSDAAMQALNPVVDYLSISFQHCDKP